MAKRRRLNRARVVEQAAVLANEDGGVAAVSLTGLAQALDIRTPSLYNHIAGLDDLQAALAAYGLRQLVAALRQAAGGRVGRDALAAMSVAYRAFAHANPGIYPLTLRAPDPDDATLVALSQELLQMLALVMASIGLTGDDALHAIRGLRAVLHGFVSLEAAEGYKMPLDADESFRRLLDTYLDGLT